MKKSNIDIDIENLFSLYTILEESNRRLNNRINQLEQELSKKQNKNSGRERRYIGSYGNSIDAGTGY